MSFLERPLLNIFSGLFSDLGSGFSWTSGSAEEGDKTGTPVREFWEIYTTYTVPSGLLIRMLSLRTLMTCEPSGRGSWSRYRICNPVVSSMTAPDMGALSIVPIKRKEAEAAAGSADGNCATDRQGYTVASAIRRAPRKQGFTAITDGSTIEKIPPRTPLCSAFIA